MDILSMMEEKRVQFDNIQEQIQNLKNELLMLQGEYRLLEELSEKEKVSDPEEVEEG